MPKRTLNYLKDTDPFIHYYKCCLDIPGDKVRVGDIIRKPLLRGGKQGEYYFVGTVGGQSFRVNPIGGLKSWERWPRSSNDSYVIAGRIASGPGERYWHDERREDTILYDPETAIDTMGKPLHPFYLPTYTVVHHGADMNPNGDIQIEYLSHPKTVAAWALKPFDVVDILGDHRIVDSVAKDDKGVWCVNTKRPGEGHVTAVEASGSFVLVGQATTAEMRQAARESAEAASAPSSWDSIPEHLRVRFEDLPQGAIFRTKGGTVGRKTSIDKYRVLLLDRGRSPSIANLDKVRGVAPELRVEYHGASTVAKTLRAPRLPGRPGHDTIAQVNVKYDIPKPKPTLYQRTFDICSPLRIEDLHLSVVLPIDPEAPGVKVGLQPTTQTQYGFWFTRITFTSPNKDDLNELRITDVLSDCHAVVGGFSSIERV